MQSISKKSMFMIVLMFLLMIVTGFTGCSYGNSWEEEKTRTERRKDREEEEKDDEDEVAEKKDQDENRNEDDDLKEEERDTEDREEKEEPVDTQNQEVQEIILFFWDDFDSSVDLITKGYKDVIDRFNEKYEGKYRVKAVTDSIDAYAYNLKSMIYGESCPDVFISDSGHMLNGFTELGATMDLTDILKDNPEWYDSFYEGMFDQLTYDGKIMAIPINFASINVFYNKEIFRKAGVSIPTTFNEWIDVCEKIYSSGYTPISCAAGTYWCLGMYAGYLCDRVCGPERISGVLTGTLDWTDSIYVEAAEKMLKLSEYFQPTAEVDDYNTATEAFYNDDAAMLIQGSWTIGQICGFNPKESSKYGIFSFPAIEGGADSNRMMLKSDNFCISKNTKNLEACVALLKMFTDETAQKYNVEVGYKFPATRCSVDKTKVSGMTIDIMELLEKTTGTFGYYFESLPTSEAGYVFDNAFMDMVLNRCSVEQGLKKIQQYFEDNIWK